MAWHNRRFSPVFVRLDNVFLTKESGQVADSSAAAAVGEQNSTMNVCRSVRRILRSDRVVSPWSRVERLSQTDMSSLSGREVPQRWRTARFTRDSRCIERPSAWPLSQLCSEHVAEERPRRFLGAGNVSPSYKVSCRLVQSQRRHFCRGCLLNAVPQGQELVCSDASEREKIQMLYTEHMRRVSSRREQDNRF